MRLAFACLACLSLAACTEDEDACFAKIEADLDRVAVTANEMGNHAMALEARKSILSAGMIEGDDDRSICDYVTAGPYLERR